MVYIGADHRGFHLKELLKKKLADQGIEVVDLGNDHLDPNDDYVDFAMKVADATVQNESNRGVILCGSGVGVDIVANKVHGIRSALVSDMQRAFQSRQHEDVNIISLPADTLTEEEAFNIIKVFLETPFSSENRHIRRLNKLEEIEEKN